MGHQVESGDRRAMAAGPAELVGDGGQGLRLRRQHGQGEAGTGQQGSQIQAELVGQDQGCPALQITPLGGGQGEEGGAHRPVQHGCSDGLVGLLL